MRNVFTIARREYRLYFATPAAYAVAFLVLFTIGLWFYGVLTLSAQQGFPPGVQVIISPLAVLLMLATPPLTTRLLAEEQRLGTIEMLLTAPIRDWELVVGKWLGVFLFLVTISAITWIYPFILNFMVDPGIDQGPLLSGYLGVLLLCAALSAIGVAISSLFSNPIAAFVATMGVFVILWWIIGPIAQATGPLGSQLLTYLDFSEHFYGNFLRGVIDVKDVIYYLSLTALGLFAATMAVETRRWR